MNAIAGVSAVYPNNYKIPMMLYMIYSDDNVSFSIKVSKIQLLIFFWKLCKDSQ